MDWLGLIKAIIDRAFYSAFLVLAFCIAALVAKGYGMTLPPDVVLWLNFAMLAAISLIVVEGGRRTLFAIGGAFGRWKSGVREEVEAVRNISALYLDEAILLRQLLSGEYSDRFEVRTGSQLGKLLQKGMLKVVRSAGYMSYICEVHPAIVARKDELLEQLPLPEPTAPKRPSGFF